MPGTDSDSRNFLNVRCVTKGTRVRIVLEVDAHRANNHRECTKFSRFRSTTATLVNGAAVSHKGVDLRGVHRAVKENNFTLHRFSAQLFQLIEAFYFNNLCAHAGRPSAYRITQGANGQLDSTQFFSVDKTGSFFLAAYPVSN